MTPRFWVVTAAAVAGVCVTTALGFWQLSRANEKLAMQSRMDAQMAQAALDGRTLRHGLAAQELWYRRIVLRGQWMQGRTVFLDNRQMQGRPGFYVLTPLEIADGGPTVVVQRGWVPRDFIDRSRLPEVPTPTGEVEVEGRIAPPPSKLYEFEASRSGAIRQNLELEQFAREIGRPLVAVSVLQSGSVGDGLSRDWPRANLGVEKHHGYAFQWFALGGLILLLYGWFQIVKRFILPR